MKMLKAWNNLLVLFYGTKLGGLIFEFLLWLDRRSDRPTKYLTPKEMAQIVREYSKVYEGVDQIKRKVKQLVQANSKEEYQRVLQEITDLVNLASYEEEMNTPRAQFVDYLRQVQVKKGTQDIVTATDMAKMIDQRIEHTYAVQQDKLKRQLLREIRKERNLGNAEKVRELEQEYIKKYGRRN